MTRLPAAPSLLLPCWMGASLAVAQTPRQGGGTTVTARCGGDLGNSFGPFDYRQHANTEASRRDKTNPLYLVHSAHFRPEMENLVQGGQGPKSPVAPEFDYTLRAFPNHHRALMALMRLTEREKNDQPQRLRWPADCYFERAVAWTPNDAMVRMLYAKFLADRKQAEAARRQLEATLPLAGDSALTHHNIGMLYFDIGDIDRALAQSQRALEMGMTRQMLKERLQAAGRWVEPAQAAASAPSAASAP